MTKEEWNEAESRLSTIYGIVKMKIDGYDVTISYVKESPTKFCLAVYVDGYIKGEWIANDCDIRRRFYRCYEKQLFNSKQKKDMFKGFTKRQRERFERENHNMMYYTVYSPYFGSFRTLKAHLIKNNKSIELVKEGT